MSVVFTDLTAAFVEYSEAQLNAAPDPDLDGLFLITVTEEEDGDGDGDGDGDVPDMDDLDNEEDGVVEEGGFVEGSYVAVYGDYNVAVTPDLITRLRLLRLMSQEVINSMFSTEVEEEEFVVVEYSQHSK